MNIQVWMEGFAATGQSQTAQKIWEGEAEDFDDAVAKYNRECMEKYGVPSAKIGGLLDGRTMKTLPGYNIWGCRLFDNEKDARESFG